MAKPKIELVNVEPGEPETILYAPLAAHNSGDGPWGRQGRLMLSLTIVNEETKAVTLRNVNVVVAGIPERLRPVFEDGLPVTIAPGGRVQWSFQGPEDCVLFPVTPAPPSGVRIELTAHGFSEPAVFTRNLRAHRAPTPSGAYRFPADLGDLEDEIWYCHGNAHAIGTRGPGTQLFAHDLDVRGDYEDDPWLLPVGNRNRNEDYRIWGKRIFAMADGVVRHAANTVPENPHPLFADDMKKALDEQRVKVWGSLPAATLAYAGNHLHIEHGGDTVQYAHLQPGSIPAHLLTPGTAVVAGEFLGLAGNSGNSSAPHLHLHAVRGENVESGPPRPLVFAPVSMVDFGSFRFASPIPWVSIVSGCSIPALDTAIWPSAMPPLEGPIEDTLVDPLSLVLSHDLYVKLKSPNPPPDEVVLGMIHEIVATAAPAERQVVVERLNLAITSLQSVAKTIEGGG